MPFILSLDEGTTSARAALYDDEGRNIGMEVRAHRLPSTRSPAGWSRTPRQIWHAQIEAARRLLERLRVDAREIAACGITNQRETTVVWDRATGEPVAPAIVWQCRRTADFCAELARAAGGREHHAQDRPGDRRLLLRQQDPLDPRPRPRRPRARPRRRPALRQHRHLADLEADRRRGPRHRPLQRLPHHADGPRDAATGTTTCCAIFDVPARHAAAHRAVERRGRQRLPPSTWARRSPSPASRATSRPRWPARPASAPASPRTPTAPAASRCCTPARRRPVSQNRLLGTRAAVARTRAAQFAIEGSVFVAGRRRAVAARPGWASSAPPPNPRRWPRSVPDTGGVYFVPAFVGLGAPHWDAGRARHPHRHHAAAPDAPTWCGPALESIAYQTRDLVEAMEADAGEPLRELRVDGGAAVNDFLMQFQADILGRPIVRPVDVETTALGAAYLAGLATGFWKNLAKWRASGAPNAASSRA